MDVIVDANFARNRRVFFAYEAPPPMAEEEPADPLNTSDIVNKDLLAMMGYQK